MTFEAIEVGTLGFPTEAYLFLQQGVITRVTSSGLAEVFDGQTYLPLAGLRRSSLKQQAENGAGELHINVPVTFPIAQQFRGTLPSALPELTIFQRHNNDGATPQIVTYWKGTIVSCEFGDRTAKLTGWDAQSRALRTLPRRVYSGVCNHQLYDLQCAVNPIPYSKTLVIETLSNLNRTIKITNLRTEAGNINTALSLGLSSGELDTFWQRGKISLNISPAELRMVVEADVGGDPDTIRIPLAFRGAQVGSEITIYAGCNHSPTHCSSKFKNFVTVGVPSSGIRIGAFPYVPVTNPFGVDFETGV